MFNKVSLFVSYWGAERVRCDRRLQEVMGGHLTLRVPETTVELQDFRPLFGQHQPRVQHACNTGSGVQIQILCYCAWVDFSGICTLSSCFFWIFLLLLHRFVRKESFLLLKKKEDSYLQKGVQWIERERLEHCCRSCQQPASFSTQRVLKLLILLKVTSRWLINNTVIAVLSGAVWTVQLCN